MPKPKNRLNIVYSTNPDFNYDTVNDEEPETLQPSQQKLIIGLDKKSRAGKQVTLIEGFIGKAEDLEKLSKNLKTLCGSGGSAKEGEIIVQGDHRDKIIKYLAEKGYKIKRNQA